MSREVGPHEDNMHATHTCSLTFQTKKITVTHEEKLAHTFLKETQTVLQFIRLRVLSVCCR